jgi:hypothetical protein
VLKKPGAGGPDDEQESKQALIVNPRLAEMWSFTPAVSQMPRRALSAPGGAVIDVTKE